MLKCDMAKGGFAACAIITSERTFLVRSTRSVDYVVEFASKVSSLCGVMGGCEAGAPTDTREATWRRTFSATS